MDTRIKRNKINFKSKMVYIGIDMHKLSWRITALVEGKIVLAITLPKPSYDSFKGKVIRTCFRMSQIYNKGSSMSRIKPMITNTNLAYFAKTGCRVQEGVLTRAR